MGKCQPTCGEITPGSLVQATYGGPTTYFANERSTWYGSDENRTCRLGFSVCQGVLPWVMNSRCSLQWRSLVLQAQLRSTIQLLGQLQLKKDASAQIIRRDIATLLGKGNITLARRKAYKLVQDETLVDLLELLEQQVGTLLDRFTELERLWVTPSNSDRILKRIVRSSPSSALVQASSSIIFAAPRLQLRGQFLHSSSLCRVDNH